MDSFDGSTQAEVTVLKEWLNWLRKNVQESQTSAWRHCMRTLKKMQKQSSDMQAKS
jgi:hypothetical protein